MFLGVVLLSACSKDDGKTAMQPLATANRTVIVYMAAENNLSTFATLNLTDMAEGSRDMPDSCHLVAFIDMADRTQLPYVAEISRGIIRKDSLYQTSSDGLTSDAEYMYRTLKWIVERYPSKEYALVLWGHADGWIIASDSVANTLSKSAPLRKAYGIDTGNNSMGTWGKWMNIPSMAKALARLPKMKFIFSDCCCFQCVESAYELKDVCEYLIGSPAEIPAAGAPYAQITPLFFSQKENFYESIADCYNSVSYNGYHTPISALRTSEMEALAQATRKVLPQLLSGGEDPITKNVIYYFGFPQNPIMYDMNDLMLANLDPDSYREWKQAADRVSVYRKVNGPWVSEDNVDFSQFTISEEKYGGMSMFVPLKRYDRNGNSYNTTIRQMGWYHAVGMGDVLTLQDRAS